MSSSRLCCCWLGPVVRLMGEGPHAAEILGLGRAARRRSSTRPLEDFAADFAQALEAKGVEDARELSFLVMMAAKGLLYTTSSTNDFERGLKRIVDAAFRERSAADRRGVSDDDECLLATAARELEALQPGGKPLGERGSLQVASS